MSLLKRLKTKLGHAERAYCAKESLETQAFAESVGAMAPALLVALLVAMLIAPQQAWAKAKGTSNGPAKVATPQQSPKETSDQELLESARVHFAADRLDHAISDYRKISKGSYRWILAKEEVSWALFRKRQLPLALSEVRSLTNDYLAAQIDLEPFLLQGLIHLYSCDYKQVFKAIQELKRLMPEYVSNMEELAQGKINAVQADAIQLLIENKGISELTPKHFMALPRYFYLEKSIISGFKSGQMPLIVGTLQKMAVAADKKNKKILQHLNLLEVEAIQRAFVPNEFGEKNKTQLPAMADRMIFNNDKELWADEIDHLQSDLFKCDSKTGKTL